MLSVKCYVNYKTHFRLFSTLSLTVFLKLYANRIILWHPIHAATQCGCCFWVAHFDAICLYNTFFMYVGSYLYVFKGKNPISLYILPSPHVKAVRIVGKYRHSVFVRLCVKITSTVCVKGSLWFLNTVINIGSYIQMYIS